MRPITFLTILILLQSGSTYYLTIQNYGKSTLQIQILEDLNDILNQMKKDLNLTSLNGLYQKQRQQLWSLNRLLK